MVNLYLSEDCQLRFAIFSDDNRILDPAKVARVDLDHGGAAPDYFFVCLSDEGVWTHNESRDYRIFIQDMDVFVAANLNDG